MKKIAVIIIASLILVSWCFTKKETVFLSFEESESIVSQNINILLKNLETFSQKNYFLLNCKTFSENDSVKFDSIINLSWFTDLPTYDLSGDFHNSQTQILLDTYFFDKKSNKEILLSGDIQNISTNQKNFIKFSDPIVDLWTWNYKSNLLSMITKNLWDKRISYDSKKIDEIKSLKNDINFVLNTIFSQNSFQNIDQVTYEWNLAYKITISQSVLDYINSHIHGQISNFDWLFVVVWPDEVNFKINNIDISYLQKDIKINWTISNQKWIINIIIDWKNTEIYFENYKKTTNLNIKNTKNYKQNWAGNFVILDTTNPKDKDTNYYEIKWDFSISPNIIYWSDLENEIKININCLGENFAGKTFPQKEPESYILLDQILWDEFSIKNFI